VKIKETLAIGTRTIGTDPIPIVLSSSIMLQLIVEFMWQKKVTNMKHINKVVPFTIQGFSSIWWGCSLEQLTY